MKKLLHLRFICALMLMLCGVGSSWAETTTYIFSKGSWDATPENWISGKNGGFTSGQGIQVTSGNSGVNGTSPISFTNVSQIVVTYCTNTSKGAGAIKVQVGTGTEQSFSVKAPSSNGTTLRETTFDFTPNETGKVKITCDCTTNSIYIYSVTITTAAATDPYTVYFNAGSGSCDTTPLMEGEAGAGVTLPSVTPVTGWTFAGWTTAAVSETTTVPEFVTVTDGKYYPSADVTLYAVYSSVSDGTSVTSTLNVAEYAAAHGWVNGTAYNGFIIDGVTYSQDGGGNNSKYYVTDNTWRFYGGGKVVLTAEGNITNVTSDPDQTFTIIDNVATLALSATTSFKSISVTYDGATTIYNSNPTAIAVVDVTGVELDKTSVELLAGKKVTITATVAPSDATNKNVVWSTSDASVATVAGGVITAVAAGTATITVTTVDGEKTATCDVTVNDLAGAGSGTEADPYDITRAKAIVDNDLIPADNVHVKGYVSSIASTSVSSGKLSYYISSTKGGEDEFEFYQGKNIGNTNFSETSDIVVGDYVIGLGKLAKYGETYEFASGNYLVKHIVIPTFSIADIVVSSGAAISPVITTSNTDSYVVTYASNNTAVVSVSADGKTLSTAGVGEATITATIGETANFYGTTTTFTVTVTHELIGIEISGDITTKTYYYGENFDYSGLVVTALYEDYSEVDVTEHVTWTSSFAIPLTTLGENKDQEIEAEFGGETATTQVAFTVLDNLTGITLDTNQAKTVYNLGETFSTEGLVVTAHYLSGDTSYDGNYLDDEDVFTFTGYDMGTLGTQTVTVTYNDGDFEAKTATYTIVVKDPEVNEILAETAGADGVSSWTVEPFTFTGDKASSSNAPSFFTNGNDFRVYSKGTFTISTTGDPMTKVVFTLSAQGKKRLAPITASEGTVATQTKGDETVTWTGSATEVTFTVGDSADFGSDGSSKAGQLCFSEMNITTPTPVAVAISGAGYSTLYYGAKNLVVPAGVSAYAFSVKEGVLTPTTKWEAGDIIAKGTAVVLEGAKGSYVFTNGAEDAAVGSNDNMLHGSDVAATTTGEAGDIFYMLSLNKDNELNSAGFYYGAADGAAFENGAHKAYLAVPTSAMNSGVRSFFRFDGMETGITAAEAAAQRGEVYTLSGIRVQGTPKAGLYIVGGKKMMVK